MKKEVVLAIFVGLLLGGVITFGMYRAKLAVQNASPAPEFVPIVTPPPTPEGGQGSGLILDTPDDEVLVRSSSLRVSGATTPQAVVVVLQGDQETITTADDQGNFSTTITINPGGNIIIVRSVSQEGVVQEVSRSIVFSTSDFFDVPESKQATSSTKTR